MDNGHNGWEAELMSLNPEQRQQVLQWLREEQEKWARQEEEWLEARDRIVRTLSIRAKT
jgi:hypothetical protein